MSSLDRAIAQIDEIFDALQQKLKQAAAQKPSPSAPSAPAAVPARADPVAEAAAAAPKQQKKKEKKEKPAKPPQAVEDPIQKANLRVAKVVSAEAVENSDKLWKCQVDVGLEAPLQIVAGLQQHIPLERMTGLLVVTILNLKPAKLAGQLSEAMILAADHTAADGTVLVRTLCPPEGAQPGDPVFLEGQTPPASTPKTLKTDNWKAIVEQLKTAQSCATYSGTPLCVASGSITVPDVPDGSGIH